MGFEPGPSKEGSWMMAQNDLVVAGIDVSKDKVDACIRSLSLRRTFPASAQGRRQLIAWFAETFGEARGQVYDAAREKLVQIVHARQGLLDLQTSLQNRGEHAAPEPVQKMQARLLRQIALELAGLEAAIAALIKATAHFAERAEIIESVPGLAETTAAGLIAAMPE